MGEATESHQGTAHWRSEYKSALNEGAVHGATYHRQHLPSYQASNPPTCIGRNEELSSYHEEYGKRGSDPRHKIGHLDDRLPVFKTTLTQGTAKGTKHMPGYQGFLPSNTSNPHVARVERGETLRSIDKTNLSEQFHANLLGYAGHNPTNPHNDRGGVRVNTQTCMGHSFRDPALSSFS